MITNYFRIEAKWAKSYWCMILGTGEFQEHFFDLNSAQELAQLKPEVYSTRVFNDKWIPRHLALELINHWNANTSRYVFWLKKP